MPEWELQFEYEVERKGPRSKLYVVREYEVSTGVKHYRETVSVDLTSDEAYSFCEKLREKERRRRADLVKEN